MMHAAALCVIVAPRLCQAQHSQSAFVWFKHIMTVKTSKPPNPNSPITTGKRPKGSRHLRAFPHFFFKENIRLERSEKCSHVGKKKQGCARLFFFLSLSVIVLFSPTLFSVVCGLVKIRQPDSQKFRPPAFFAAVSVSPPPTFFFVCVCGRAALLTCFCSFVSTPF